MRTSSSLEPAGDVLIAGLTVELLYGIFSLLSRKSEMATVESLRDYFRKFGVYCVTTQSFLKLLCGVRMRTSSTLEPEGDGFDFFDVAFLLAKDDSGIYGKMCNEVGWPVLLRHGRSTISVSDLPW